MGSKRQALPGSSGTSPSIYAPPATAAAAPLRLGCSALRATAQGARISSIKARPWAVALPHGPQALCSRSHPFATSCLGPILITPKQAIASPGAWSHQSPSAVGDRPNLAYSFHSVAPSAFPALHPRFHHSSSHRHRQTKRAYHGASSSPTSLLPLRGHYGLGCDRQGPARRAVRVSDYGPLQFDLSGTVADGVSASRRTTWTSPPGTS